MGSMARFQALSMKKLDIYKTKTKKVLFGVHGSRGIIYKIAIYALLIGIGFVYLYPLLYMLSLSFKSLSDLLNPLVNWIPTEFYTGSYKKAMKVTAFFPSLLQTLYVTALPALAETAISAMVGYGFARFKFPGKNILFEIGRAHV
jgi:multiple sugar transport system permease protein